MSAADPTPRFGRTVIRMTTYTVLSADLPSSEVLHVAVAAYLARFKATSRTHAESDLRAYLRW